MFNPNEPQRQRTSQENLECQYASRSIEQSDYLWPEFRLELVDGKFLVGGTLEGSRWLLQEALIGWGLESAIALAPLDHWWEALGCAYEVQCYSQSEWLTWAEEQPISSNYRQEWWPPLGSQYKGEHRWIRDRLRQSLSTAISQGILGACFGPNYGMQVETHVFTPDILMRSDVRLAENTCHDCYMEGGADMVVEIVLPEHVTLEEQVRRRYYEQGNVAHYWIVNPVTKQIQFWQWYPEGYQLQSLDPDGCYRGVSGLTFSPAMFWSAEHELSAFTSVQQPRRWHLEFEEGEELGWGSLPFEPNVALSPYSIEVEQFISWCPETKLEGGPFPLIGGSEVGTRNVIAMLLMSLGLVDAVRLMPGYEWVRVLRRIERQQQQDCQKRQEWWSCAQAIAHQLQTEYQVGGVGLIGNFLQSDPLNAWSELHLVLWDVPEQSKMPNPRQTLTDAPPTRITEVQRASPAEWQQICQGMTVLVGQWRRQEQPRPQKRLQFQWLPSPA